MTSPSALAPIDETTAMAVPYSYPKRQTDHLGSLYASWMDSPEGDGKDYAYAELQEWYAVMQSRKQLLQGDPEPVGNVWANRVDQDPQTGG